MGTVAYNLKKLMKWQAKKVQADVKALQIKAGKSLLKHLYLLTAFIGNITSTLSLQKHETLDFA